MSGLAKQTPVPQSLHKYLYVTPTRRPPPLVAVIGKDEKSPLEGVRDSARPRRGCNAAQGYNGGFSHFG